MKTYPNDADGDALRRLAESGVDMSRPRPVDFMVDVEDEAAAQRVLEKLTASGYECEIDFDDGEPDLDEDDGDHEDLDAPEDIDPDDEFGPAWTVVASVVIVPDYDEVIKRQRDITAACEPDGYCDSWGVFS